MEEVLGDSDRERKNEGAAIYSIYSTVAKESRRGAGLGAGPSYSKRANNKNKRES
jgi:hypothetical protein